MLASQVLSTRNKPSKRCIEKIIQQENITFVNIYVPDIGAPKFIKQILTSKGRNRQQYSNSRELCYTTYSIRGGKVSQKTSVNDTLCHVRLTFHPKPTEYTCSSTQGTSSRIDPMLGHKTNLTKFEKTGITSAVFSDTTV